MMEYAGIDAERIASMEERLKRDVLAEVGAGKGRGGGDKGRRVEGAPRHRGTATATRSLGPSRARVD